MNKTLSGFMVAAMVLLPAIAAARTISVAGGTVDCETSMFTDATTFIVSPATQNQLVGCVAANGNPLLVMQPWGLNMGDSMIYQVPAGAIVKDEAGITFLCPETTGIFGCIKLIGMEYWKSQARAIAKQTNGYGQYRYWLTH